MISLQMTIKLNLIIVLFQWMDIGCCVTIVRDYKNDTLICPKRINCEKFGAVRNSDNSCICEEGSFVLQDQTFHCLRNSGTYADCKFYFAYFQFQIQAIQAISGFHEFLYNIVTGRECQQMDIDSVKMIGADLNWENSEVDFKITSALNNSYVRWKDPNTITAKSSRYIGQLLKFNLKCSLAGGTIIKGCLLGKVKGSMSWSKDVCEATPVPTKPTSPSSTEKSLQVTVSKSPASSGNDKSNIGMIAGVTVGMIVVIGIIVALIFFLKKRKPSQKEYKNNNEQSKLKQQNDDDDDDDDDDAYATIEPDQFENASYLTSMQANQSIVRKDDVDTYDSPYVNDPKNSIQQYSKLNRKEKEDNSAPQESEYSALKIPQVESPYQRLSTSEDVTAYEDMSEDASYGKIY